MNTKAFYEYLKEQGMAESTATEHINNVLRFELWAKENHISGLQYMHYRELLAYVQYLKERSLSIATMNIRVGSIRNYFELLKEQGIMEHNPARRLNIKGNIKKVTHDPFSYEELENLYMQYSKPREHYYKKTAKQAHLRSSVILGFIIWQGANSGQLKKMETGHVNLQEGIVYIPSGFRGNPRELKLDPRQIMLLHRYLTETSFKEDWLFGKQSHNHVQWLVRELKMVSPSLRNAEHIRASVLIHWTKLYDKRRVQHMAGYKSISSVEKHEKQELSGLTDLLGRHHPFG